MKKLIRQLLVTLAAAGFAFGTSIAAEIYKSADERGQTVYSDRAPPTGPVEKVSVDPAPAQYETERARSEVEQANQLLDSVAEERRQKQQQKAAEMDEKQRRQVACAAARSRLDQLTSIPPNRRLVMRPDGTSERVSWEEMQRLIEQARQQAAQDCSSVGTSETADSHKKDAGTGTRAERAKGATAGSTSERTTSAAASKRDESTASTTRQKTSN